MVNQVRVVAISMALLLGLLTGCGLMAPTPHAVLDRMKAVPGVADTSGYGTNGANGRVHYTFTARLVDDPSAETFVGLVNAYREGMLAMDTPENEQFGDFTVSWRQSGVGRTMQLWQTDTLKMPKEEYLRAIPSWPTNLNLSASGDSGGFALALASDDTMFRSELAQLAAAGIPAGTTGAGSPRYVVMWDDTAPLDLFDRVVAGAPDAARVDVGSSAPDPGNAEQGWVQVTWSVGSGGPSPGPSDTMLVQMQAVTDVWAGLTKPVGLSFLIGTSQQVDLLNNRCPSGNSPRDAEFWAYANRSGHHVVLAPASC